MARHAAWCGISEICFHRQYVMLSAMEGIFGLDQPDWDLHHVTVPALVINAQNALWTDQYKQYVSSLSTQTDYRTINGVGHWLMLENPADFNFTLITML